LEGSWRSFWGAISEFERSQITERVRAGIRNARIREGGSAATTGAGRQQDSPSTGLWTLLAYDFEATGRQAQQRHRALQERSKRRETIWVPTLKRLACLGRSSHPLK